MDVQKALQAEMEAFMGRQFTHGAVKYFSHIPGLLKKHSPHSLKIPIENYEKLFNVSEGNCDYVQAGSCLNMLVGQTMASIDMAFEEYIEMQKVVEAAIKLWSGETGKEKTRLQSKLEALGGIEKKSGRKIGLPGATA